VAIKHYATVRFEHPNVSLFDQCLCPQHVAHMKPATHSKIKWTEPFLCAEDPHQQATSSEASEPGWVGSRFSYLGNRLSV